MRDFRLNNTAGCLVDSFQIITRTKQTSHHHQDNTRTTQNKLCGERRETTGKLKFTRELFPEKSISQPDVARSMAKFSGLIMS